MGLFNFLKGADTAAEITFPATLGAASKGRVIPMEEIPDPVFSIGAVGRCCGIEPDEGMVYAPIDSKVGQVADTGHAIGLEAGGMDILIHVGVDTVDMEGKGFVSKVKVGQSVQKGDLLMTMDLDAIRAAGHPTTVITVITNSDDYTAVETVASGVVENGDALMRVSK